MAKLSLGDLQQLACMRIDLTELADKVDPTRKRIPLDGCIRILSDAFYEGSGGAFPPNECMSTFDLKKHIEQSKKHSYLSQITPEEKHG